MSAAAAPPAPPAGPHLGAGGGRGARRRSVSVSASSVWVTGSGEQTVTASAGAVQATRDGERRGRRQRAGRHRRRDAARRALPPGRRRPRRRPAPGGRLARVAAPGTARGGAGPSVDAGGPAPRWCCWATADGSWCGVPFCSAQSSGSEQHLADVLARLDDAVRLGGAGHRQPAVDDRADDAAFDVGPHVVHAPRRRSRPCRRGPSAGRDAQRRGVHRRALAHQLAEVQLRLRAALHADASPAARPRPGRRRCGPGTSRPCCRG